jgi:dolichol-phosphate mannosyltransferase
MWPKFLHGAGPERAARSLVRASGSGKPDAVDNEGQGAAGGRRDAAAGALPRVLVITPTFNEVDNIERFVAATLAVVPWAHVLIVDDASPDGTGAVADGLVARDARVSVLHRPGKLGLGRAYVEGFRWGLARGFELLFEMDADLSHDPAHLPAFLAAFERGADVVVGSRNVPGGGVRGWGAGRNALSKGGSLYSRLVLGVGVRDLTTGFKGYTRRAVEELGIETLESNGYSFQIETTYRAVARGLRVVEVPIVFVDRRAGESKMNTAIFLEAVGIVWKIRRGRAGGG